MFCDRGQANSPFELLVAIIIMGFVIIIGSQLISNANEQVCLAGIEKAMTVFKSNLEDTASYRTSNKFEFRPVSNGCYNENKSVMRIELIRDNALRCGAICGRATNSCYVFIFTSDTLVNGYREKCLNLPINTSFVDGVNCPLEEDGLNTFRAINPTAPNITLSSGTYVLRNVAPAGMRHSEVCVYWKR